MVTSAPNRRQVFIIHGRNVQARNTVEHFVRILGLEPLDFERVAASLGGAPFIGDIVRKGMQSAWGLIAVFTPDEIAALRPEHRGDSDKDEDRQRWQARPNVIFEAGMAFGIAPERTALVTLGTDTSMFSDVAGVHLVRLNNSIEARGRLRNKLLAIGCEIDQATTEWTDVARSGDFEACVARVRQVQALDPFSARGISKQGEGQTAGTSAATISAKPTMSTPVALTPNRMVKPCVAMRSTREMLEVENPFRIAAGERGTLVVADQMKLHVSRDGGQSWSLLRDFSGELQILAIELHGQDLYVASDAGIVSFDLSTGAIQRTRSSTHATYLRVNPRSPHELYCLLGQKEIVRSTDRFETRESVWQGPSDQKYAKKVSVGPYLVDDTTLWLKCLRFDRDGNMLVGSEKAEIRKITDDGSAVLEHNMLFVDPVYEINEISGSVGDTYFIRLSGHHKMPIWWMTSDHGKTFDPWRSPFTSYISAIEASSDRKIFFLLTNKKLYQSMDQGGAWDEIV